MTYEPVTTSVSAEAWYIPLFEALSSNSYLMRIDAPRYTIIAVTPQHLSLTGLKKEDVIGKGVFEVFPPNVNDPTDTGAQDFLASLQYVINHKEPHQLPIQRYDIMDNQGRYMEKYWKAESKPMLSPEGEVAYIIHSTEDITDQVMADEMKQQIKGMEQADALRRLYETVTNNTPDLIYVFDLNYRFTYANKALLTMWGRSLESSNGKGFRDLGYEEWHAQMHEREIDEVVATKKPIRGTVSFPHSELGVRIYDYIFAPVFDEKGEVEAIAGTARDITDIKRAEEKIKENEERFSAAVKAVQGVIWTNNANGEMIGEQQGWSSLTGQSFEEYQGYGWADAVHPDDAQPTIDAWNEAVRERRTFEFMHRVKRRSGEWGYFSIHAVPLFDAAGSIREWVGVHTDITEKRIAETALLESENRFRTMADSSPVMIWTLDAEGNSTYYNKRATEFTGHSEEELKDGKTWQTAIHPDDIDHAASVVGKAVQSNQPYQMECRMRRADGEWRWLLSHGTPRFGKNNELLGYVGSSVDITDRKLTEEALFYRKALLEAQNEAVPDAILIVDTKGKMISFNQHFAKLWNIPQEITEAKDDTGALNFAMTQVADPKGFIERVNYCYSHPDETCMEEVLFRDGRIIERYGNAVKGDNGTNYGWIWYFRDITERKKVEETIRESEERFRTISDESPIFVFIIDSDPLAPVSYWNKTWLEYTGQTSEEAKGRAWDGIIHPDDVPVVMDIYVPAFTNKQPYFIPAVRTKRYDGVYRWHAFKGNPRYLSDGSFNGYVGVGFDVHEQITAKEQLEIIVNERTKELQRSNDDLQQFAHVASHDLKEPVRKVKTFTSRLEQHLEGMLDETSLRYIEKIHSATNRMFSMIDGVLTYSTINASTQAPEMVDLNEVMKNIEADFEVVIQKTGATLTYCGLPSIEGAPVLLYQLFYNLINNAIKFAKAGIAPQINITSEIIGDDDRRTVKLRLSDNGIGFEEEQSSSIFETFTRLNSKDKYEGTGLGLALCKKIVERHSGSISASGVPGEGATFTILLPARQNEKVI
jgi:hypothetical protein